MGLDSTPKTPASGIRAGSRRATPTSQNVKNQRSILGFFNKSSPAAGPASSTNAATAGHNESPSSPVPIKTTPTAPPRARRASGRQVQDMTPIASSDAIDPDEEPLPKRNTTPRRRAKVSVSYAESDDDSMLSKSKDKSVKRRKMLESSDVEDDDNIKGPDGPDFSDDDLDDFIVDDESEPESKPKKRKRASNARSRNTSAAHSRPKSSANGDTEDKEDLDIDLSETTPSTARKWVYDPENTTPSTWEPTAPCTPSEHQTPGKGKTHTIEPERRYPWLASITDIDRHPPNHPEYDPRTIYIPPTAWAKFSPFEKQYWEIKQKFWDTVVFFKKGKFYELYENDATIGHQLFDLKLTDRVNMRMVGVPEMSLDHWANQFVARGYKIARVDQKETALGKEMREKGDKQGGKPAKEDKIIRRELSCVLTAGTLVDGSMLQDDMATYCVAIKEALDDGHPSFGIAFVDAATGHFFLTEFVDDTDMTRFETFVAQTRPQELLLEKSNLSSRALRILKNNTPTTTIWNYLNPGKEFWGADLTNRELEANGYFEDDQWPTVLREAKDKELVMSSFGALTQYLRLLKLDRDLISMGNISHYDPIRKASSLVLDGKTLINLEIFANSFDGGSDGTLFQLLNRCITPFGKRMFKQWVCHPLVNGKKINERLDAVEYLNSDGVVRDQFCSELSKLPDLERLISRVHAGTCKPQDFLRVIEGFEQIDYTMNLLKEDSTKSSGDGIIGRLLASMPDLSVQLKQWESKFDRTKTRDSGLIVPLHKGEFEDFDESEERIVAAEADLQKFLKDARKQLNCSSIIYRDNGKEIYQLEVPVKVKNIPNNWSQMSATKTVKRYYTSELRQLIRELQEAQEIHSHIVKDLGYRLYQEFDQEYPRWLAAIRIVSTLDCLISLSKASLALGHPSSRPIFVDEDGENSSERSVVEFEELRHPCMLMGLNEFIPNDIKLGGSTPKINLLTGANAAGKSTILRMTCTAVIMAQLGCFVPCQSARLTPVDRIMSRLGANDNIFASQSTFFVELSETKKILSEATNRSLVILDELGRGTSSYDGVAVAQAVLHHIATHIGCVGFFATHYHSLAMEFESHVEIAPKRMQIQVDNDERRVTFLYKLEEGVADGSFGMHCASMCGIPQRVIDEAEVAAEQWEHTSQLKESLEKKKGGGVIGLGWWSDVAWACKEDGNDDNNEITDSGIDVLLRAIEKL